MRNITAGFIISFIIISLGCMVLWGIFRIPVIEKIPIKNVSNSISDSSDFSKFIFLSGNAEVKKNDSEDWKSASLNEDMVDLKALRTSAGRATVSFKEGLLLKTEGDTEMEIGPDGQANIVLKSGKMFIGKINSDREEFGFVVGDAIISSNRVYFFADVNDNAKKAKLVVVNGELTFKIGDKIEIIRRGEKLEMNNDSIQKNGVTIDDFGDFEEWSYGKENLKEWTVPKEEIAIEEQTVDVTDSTEAQSGQE